MDAGLQFERRLDTSAMAFGRHETFPIRHGWLTKGFWEYVRGISEEDLDVFRSENAVVKLGVGKNMVSSIKYWLQATRLLTNDSGALKPTELGLRLFGGPENNTAWDPYLEDENTLWVLHWELATNSRLATSFFWLFNLYHKQRFNQEDLLASLNDFVVENAQQKYSNKTLKNDVAVITRMYSLRTPTGKLSIEDSFDSPFSELGLVQDVPGTKEFISSPAVRPDIDPAIVAYAMSTLFAARGASSISVSDLIYSDGDFPALGSVFRLSENAGVALIERAAREFPTNFDIRETAGNHQVYLLNRSDPIDYLKAYYGEVSKDVA